jgi:hypothetical protein
MDSYPENKQGKKNFRHWRRRRRICGRTTGSTITGDGTPTSATATTATGSQAAAKSNAAAAANLHDLYARVVFAGAVPVAGMIMM